MQHERFLLSDLISQAIVLSNTTHQGEMGLFVINKTHDTNETYVEIRFLIFVLQSWTLYYHLIIKALSIVFFGHITVENNIFYRQSK